MKGETRSGGVCKLTSGQIKEIFVIEVAGWVRGLRGPSGTCSKPVRRRAEAMATLWITNEHHLPPSSPPIPRHLSLSSELSPHSPYSSPARVSHAEKFSDKRSLLTTPLCFIVSWILFMEQRLSLVTFSPKRLLRSAPTNPHHSPMSIRNFERT